MKTQTHLQMKQSGGITSLQGICPPT